MKIDESWIRKIEEENNVVALFSIKKRNQYLYIQIKKNHQQEIRYMSVYTPRGKEHTMPFINKDILSDMEKDKKEKKEVMKRHFMGRPYVFCEGCDKKQNCSLDYPCPAREAYLNKKNHAERVKDDDRYWKNGVPKKKLVLCKSSKYRYAHKKSAGLCQGDKCAFYVGGKCELGIDIEEKECYNISD